jgi:Fur family peroxide stress response transcriptional regulator
MGKPEPRLAEIIDKLRRRGYRITPQRSEILRNLTESDIHPSVEQVFKQVMTAFPMTSLATVYKTVDMLKAEGEILELGFANGNSRYDGSKSYPHPHLICIKYHRSRG